MNQTKTNRKFSPWNLDIYKDVGLLLRGEDARKVVEAGCENREVAQISLSDSKTSVLAEFSRIAEETLILELEENLGIEPGEPVQVIFTSRNRLLKFISPLRCIQESEGTFQMKLLPPLEIRSTDIRQSFRVPTTECLDLVAHFEFEGVPLEGIVLDISNGGLCTDLLSTGQTGLKRGDRGRLVLHCQNVRTEDEVEVRDIRKSIVHLAYVTDGKHRGKKE